MRRSRITRLPYIINRAFGELYSNRPEDFVFLETPTTAEKNVYTYKACHDSRSVWTRLAKRFDRIIRYTSVDCNIMLIEAMITFSMYLHNTYYY